MQSNLHTPKLLKVRAIRSRSLRFCQYNNSILKLPYIHLQSLLGHKFSTHQSMVQTSNYQLL